MSKNDLELIYQGYLDYFENYVQKNKYTPQTARQKWQAHANLLRKALVCCESVYLTELEKRKIIRDGKTIYLEFCRCIKSFEQSVGEGDHGRMYTLLSYISEYELEILERYRYQLFAGERLNLEKILSDTSFRTQIAQRPIDKLLDQYFDDIYNVTCYKGEEKVYITATGKKYHEAGCPYCKTGIQRKKVTYRLADNYGLEPCQCILDQRARQEQEDRFMTVFIDESIRKSPWDSIDGASKHSQGSFSYIICQGRLTNEQEITAERTVTTSSGLLDEKVGSTNAAIETINNVLMKLAFIYGFNRDVIIYTDNQSASFTWEQNEQNKYLETLFTSVKVIFIPREENTVADSIGREVSFFDIPTSVMEKIIYKCKVYDEFAEKIVN